MELRERLHQLTFYWKVIGVLVNLFLLVLRTSWVESGLLGTFRDCFTVIYSFSTCFSIVNLLSCCCESKGPEFVVVNLPYADINKMSKSFNKSFIWQNVMGVAICGIAAHTDWLGKKLRVEYVINTNYYGQSLRSCMPCLSCIFPVYCTYAEFYTVQNNTVLLECLSPESSRLMLSDTWNLLLNFSFRHTIHSCFVAL